MPLRSVNRHRQSLSRSNDSLRFRHRPYAFDTSIVVPLRSSSCLTPDLVLARPFPSAFTTLDFVQSRRRWFGTCSCKPVPRGRPSSVEQLRTSSAFRLFAVLVAHYSRVSGQVLLKRIATPGPDHLASHFRGTIPASCAVVFTKPTPTKNFTFSISTSVH